MRALITGSSGMIGTALAEQLAQLGHEVVGADWRPNAWSEAVGARTLEVDLRDRARVAELPHRFDVVFHLAANARVHELVVDPSLARDNFETSFNVFEHCRQHRIPRLVVASSREVYGTTDVAEHAEADVRIALSASPYAACKLASEALAASYARCYGLDVVVTRFSNVYGRYDTSDRVIPKFLRAAAQGEELEIYGEDKLLDFTYLDDTVSGLCAVLDRFEVARGGTFNIASGTGSTLLELARTLLALTGSSSRIVVGPNRTGEVVRYVAEISHARAVLGYAPRVGLREGLEHTLAWYRARGWLERA